jgi:hypothetical protein
MSLAMFEFNLYLILKKHKSNTRKILMNIRRYNLTARLKTKFGFNNNIYQRPWRRFTSFINNVETSPSPFFMELVKWGGDVTNANTVEYIHMNVHPCDL